MDVIENIEGNTICAHGDSLVIPVRSYTKTFPQEFQDHIDRKGCPFPVWQKRRNQPREGSHQGDLPVMAPTPRPAQGVG